MKHLILKTILYFVLFLSNSAMATDYQLEEYNWKLTDISSKKISKESLFLKMDRNFIKTSHSICSNRALMWAYDFKRDFNFNTAKIFMFYTKKARSVLRRTWWYHVAPVVNENGKMWVLDAGFPGFIRGPQNKEEWLYSFSQSKNCKEIKSNETELVELIFSRRIFPTETSYGNFNCYYRIVPHTFWTPEIVAENILGRDSEGQTVRTERDQIKKNELYQACIEATTKKLEYAVGINKKKCEDYINF